MHRFGAFVLFFMGEIPVGKGCAVSGISDKK